MLTICNDIVSNVWKSEMSHCERNVAYMRFAHNIDFNINFSHNCALNVKAQIYMLEQQGLIKGPNLYVGATRLDYVIVILLMPEKEYKYTDVKQITYLFYCLSLFLHCILYVLGTRIKKLLLMWCWARKAMEQMPQFPVNCMGQVYVWLMWSVDRGIYQVLKLCYP